jgi:hypothetical protein
MYNWVTVSAIMNQSDSDRLDRWSWLRSWRGQATLACITGAVMVVRREKFPIYFKPHSNPTILAVQALSLGTILSVCSVGAGLGLACFAGNVHSVPQFSTMVSETLNALNIRRTKVEPGDLEKPRFSEASPESSDETTIQLNDEEKMKKYISDWLKLFNISLDDIEKEGGN